MVGAWPLEVFRDRVRELTNRNRGANLRTVVEELAVYLRGWKQYFHLAETPRIFGELDGWIRRRLRMLRLKQWKRGTTACPALMAAGVAESAAKHLAGRLRRWWWASNHPAIEQLLSLDHFDAMGLPRLAR